MLIEGVLSQYQAFQTTKKEGGEGEDGYTDGDSSTVYIMVQTRIV